MSDGVDFCAVADCDLLGIASAMEFWLDSNARAVGYYCPAVYCEEKLSTLWPLMDALPSGLEPVSFFCYLSPLHRTLHLLF